MDTEDRRLAAIVVADVVGYSAMMERDEADALSRVFAMRSQVFEPESSSRGGRIVKTMGDGLLVEFPSAVKAVEAAVAVQKGLAEWPDIGERLMLRIGLHIGDVMIREDDIFGSGVNIAARLEQAAEPGGILISGAAHDQLGSRLGSEFDDAGLLTLKNISTPVRVWSWGTSGASKPASTPIYRSKPLIAVLPFENLSGNPDEDYLANGMVEDLTTKLARFHWFRVVARGSSYTLSEQAADHVDIGRRLNAEYVLKGSIRRAGTRIRVAVQLIDITDGSLIWADSFDRVIDDLFDLQDEIVGSIVGTVIPQFVSFFQPTQGHQHRASFPSWESAMRGWNLIWRLQGPDDAVLNARRLFQKALDIDPNNALAHCGLAYSHTNPYYQAQLERDIPAARDSARNALDVDDRDAFAWCLLGIAELYANNHESAGHHLKKSIAINPSLALANGYLAVVNCFRPDSNATDSWALRVEELSPVDPILPLVTAARSMARFGEGDYAVALAFADEALLEAPRLQPAWRLRAASLEMLGEHDAAARAITQALSLGPLTMGWVKQELTPFSDPEAWANYLNALEAAGTPE